MPKTGSERSRAWRARRKRRLQVRLAVEKHRLDKKKKEMAKKANTVNGGKGKKVNVEEIDAETEAHSVKAAEAGSFKLLSMVTTSLVARVQRGGHLTDSECNTLDRTLEDVKDVPIRARIAEAWEQQTQSYGRTIDAYEGQRRSTNINVSAGQTKKPAKKGTTTYSSDDENSSDVEKENSTG